jgi:hypothetical protein
VAKAGANNVLIWGFNPVVADSSYLGSFSNVTLNNEIDFGVSSTSTAGNGLQFTGIATAESVDITAINIEHGTGPVPIWSVGFECNIGATVLGTCLTIAPVSSTNGSASQTIRFSSFTSVGANPFTLMFQDAPGNFHVNMPTSAIFNVNGPVDIAPGTFSRLPSCNSSVEGTQAPVTDSTTNTWGATITGSGSDHVLAYCNGSAWTVAAK